MPFELPTTDARHRFLLRVLTHVGYALGLALLFLGVGTSGYHFFVGPAWHVEIFSPVLQQSFH